MRALLPVAWLALLASCSTATGGEAVRGATPPGPAQPTTAQLVAARQAGMHMAATLLYRGIKAAVKEGSDVKEQVHQPEGIALWAAAIPGLFPPGSAHPESRARPEIWANKPDFDRKAAELGAAADRLAALAKAGDTAGFAAQAPAVEAACAACHKLYRSD
ncbi:MAG TPA: cytochrome c [Allosphingosinicella sp.]|jgi:cytochrome c556